MDLCIQKLLRGFIDVRAHFEEFSAYHQLAWQQQTTFCPIHCKTNLTKALSCTSLYSQKLFSVQFCTAGNSGKVCGGKWQTVTDWQHLPGLVTCTLKHKLPHYDIDDCQLSSLELRDSCKGRKVVCESEADCLSEWRMWIDGKPVPSEVTLSNTKLLRAWNLDKRGD